MSCGALAVILGGLLSACSAGDTSSGDTWSPGSTSGGAGRGGSAGASNAGGGGSDSSGGGGIEDTGSGGYDPGTPGGSDGAGGDVGTGGTGPGSGGGDTYTPPTGDLGLTTRPDVKCNPISDGKTEITVTINVNGASKTQKRNFLVQMPTNTSNMALLFLWHGFGQDAAPFRDHVVFDPTNPAENVDDRWVPFDPNAFPESRLMIVTPDDTGQFPVFGHGLDWDIIDGTYDFSYFEGMMQCIQEQYTIDTTRIYSFGFSAGAVFTNLLSAKYPRLFAATMSISGMWLNDPEQQKEIVAGLNSAFGNIVKWGWPDFNPADRGNVLLTHGGPNDQSVLNSLEKSAIKALPFLHAANRTVVECIHDFGHTLEPDLTQKMFYDYMWSHRRGGPPITGLPLGFPTESAPVGRSTCKFHPAP